MEQTTEPKTLWIVGFWDYEGPSDLTAAFESEKDAEEYAALFSGMSVEASVPILASNDVYLRLREVAKCEHLDETARSGGDWRCNVCKTTRYQRGKNPKLPDPEWRVSSL